MKILIVTAHPDDLEFGMGATLAKLVNQRTKTPLDTIPPTKGAYKTAPEHQIKIHVFSNSADVKGNDGILQELSKSIHGVYGLSCTLHEYSTMHFGEHYQAIRDDIFRIKQEFHPDVVYCKSPNSRSSGCAVTIRIFILLAPLHVIQT